MKKFKKLQSLLFVNDITQEDLAELLGKSKTYVSMCMRGVADWRQRDMYTIMDALNIDYTEVFKYFPKDYQIN